MSNSIDIKIDTSPYIPDININNKIYQTFDTINLNTIIPTYQTIFIFNLHYDENQSYSFYDDPNYMLYGIQNSSYEYNLPSYLYFKPNSKNPYNVITDISTLTPEISDLLTTIGYNTTQIIIPSNNIFYQLLSVYDSLTQRTDECIFIFFYVPLQIEINYNKYLSSVYYNQKYWNILLYPFVNNLQTTFNYQFNIEKPNILSQGQNYIEYIQFDNRDLCKYTDKIDYKYMERKTYQNNYLNNIQKLNAYSKNLNNFNDYINSNSIYINLNEVNKLNYTENQNINYTDNIVINKHINNNITYTNKSKTVSLTLDNKFSYINNKKFNDNINYSTYINNDLNLNSLYQISKNYYINGFVSLSVFNVEDELRIINLYIHKLSILINPNIINPLFTSVFIITDITPNNNKLEFISGTNTLQFNNINNIIQTETYYQNIYKIIFMFDNYTYAIILTISYYNSDKIKIVNLDRSTNKNDLGFSSITYLDETLTLSPCIYNVKSPAIILENTFDFGLIDIKYYNFTLNYNYLSHYKSDFNNINVSHFYNFISNVVPDMNYIDDNLNVYKLSNTFNVVENKVNNLVKNIILLNNNWNSIIYNFYNTKTIFLLSLNLDTNIHINYVDNFIWNTDIYYNSNNLLNLPIGKYKILKYKNYFPKNDLLISNTVNDNIVKNINTINEFSNYNFCVLIKLPDKNKYHSLRTKIYLCVCRSNYEIYKTTDNNILVYELFNYVNANNPNYKVIFNLLTNNYMNFNQINIIAETYKTYTEMNTLLLNYNNLHFKQHKSKYISDIVKFDYERFNVNLLNQSNELIYANKNTFKNILLIYNLIQELNNCFKCYLYLNQLKLSVLNKNILIDLIKFNAGQNIIINIFNYNLRILYGTCSSFVDLVMNNLNNIDYDITLEQINNFILNVNVVIQYILSKLKLIVNPTVNIKSLIISSYLNVQIQNLNLNQDEENILMIIKYNYCKLETIYNQLQILLGNLTNIIKNTEFIEYLEPNINEYIININNIITETYNSKQFVSSQLNELQNNIDNLSDNCKSLKNNLQEYIYTCNLINKNTNIDFINTLNDIYLNSKFQEYYNNIKNDNNDLNNVSSVNDVVKQFMLFVYSFINNEVNNILDKEIIVDNDIYNFNDIDKFEYLDYNIDDKLLYFDLSFEYVNINNPEI